MTTIYDFTVTDNSGKECSLSAYQGKVLLVVNTATQCGLTPQYSELQSLYNDFHAQGFEILDFPCNQFREQAPQDDAGIQTFCETHYGTTFPRFAKIDVNGIAEVPLYKWLKTEQPEDTGDRKFADLLIKLASLGEKREGADIKWNFTKFLINRNGECVARFAPSTKPSEIQNTIETLL